MNKISLLLLCLFPAGLWAHCEVPCGIYDDAARIMALGEHITTIEKAMAQIEKLAGNQDAQSMNQIIRWVKAKETHAEKIQNVISAYFLTQRIKPAKENSKEYELYLNRTLLLQQILVSAMKCKQTVDIDYAIKTQQLINAFSDIYFDEHGREHLEKIR
ncbi:MAG: superoxide dismutase [Ni] [Candidatus Neomarinimicrobiota bacterium]